jgi:hypothetical protein
MSVLNRDLMFLPNYAAILSLPFADKVLRTRPVAKPQRLTYFRGSKRAINPNRALAVAIAGVTWKALNLWQYLSGRVVRLARGFDVAFGNHVLKEKP